MRLSWRETVRVSVAPSVGFCKGVKRAFALAEKAIRENPGSTYLLGELIHNHEAMNILLSRGARVVEDPQEIPQGATVVTRSHGIKRDLWEELRMRGFQIVDTTCPRVKKLQILSQGLEKEGYRIFLLGKKEHPEIQALLSYLSGKAWVLSGAEEWSTAPFFNLSVPCAVLAQTTFSIRAFMQFVEWVGTERLPHVHIFRTLCGETEARQRELERAVAEGTQDLVVVVGGKHSANTRSLFEIAQKMVPTLWVENVEELKGLSLPTFEHAFVTSGTSTPDAVVLEVSAYFESLEGSLDDER
ncbi:MAG: 4-hydroxy-3-methylbut-2-enyl diphosphate reductase [Candidatus Caldatribacteriaceae bacterium]